MHDFPCFFQVGNPACPPIIGNFLPIGDQLLFQALFPGASVAQSSEHAPFTSDIVGSIPVVDVI